MISWSLGNSKSVEYFRSVFRHFDGTQANRTELRALFVQVVDNHAMGNALLVLLTTVAVLQVLNSAKKRQDLVKCSASASLVGHATIRLFD